MREAVIIAGGKGLRLKGQIDVPKPFLVINEDTGETLIERQFRWLAAYNFEHIVMATSRDTFKYLRANYSKFLNEPWLDVSIEEENLGTGGGLRKALEFAEEPYFYCFNVDDIAFYSPEELYAMKNPHNVLLIQQARLPFGEVKVDMGRVVSFEEKPQIDKYISVGHYLFNKEEILPSLPEVGDLEKTLLVDVAQRGLLFSHILKGTWITVNTYKDLLEARKHMKLA
jgi:NDP-sugar pyrophosphorylase family protein